MRKSIIVHTHYWFIHNMQCGRVDSGWRTGLLMKNQDTSPLASSCEIEYSDIKN